MLKALSLLTISVTLAGCVAVPVDDVYGAPYTSSSVIYVPRPVYIPQPYYNYNSYNPYYRPRYYRHYR
jgi:hypothetical protein